jgi:hypothetical protein
VRSRYSWPPRGVPIDPSSQALPDNQFVMLSVHNALNQPSNPKLIRLRCSAAPCSGARLRVRPGPCAACRGRLREASPSGPFTCSVLDTPGRLALNFLRTCFLFGSTHWKTASSTIRPTRPIIKECEIVGGGREGVAAEGKTNGTSADGLSGVARCSALPPSVVGQGPRAVISAALE